MSGDSRKDFVLATTGNFFSIPVSDSAISGLSDAGALNTFLDDGNCSVLAARCVEKKVSLTNKVNHNHIFTKDILLLPLLLGIK